MKLKIVIVVLAVACLGLAIAFFATKQQSEEQHAADVNSMMGFSNAVAVQINDLNHANTSLTNDLGLSQQLLAQLTNNLATAAATLVESKAALVATQGELADSKAALVATQGQVSNLTVHVTDLEGQNKLLDQRASELASTIAQLNVQIEDTRHKLATSEKDSAYLQQELQRQMAQKAEIEHKFNDLDELRQQISKIKTDIFVARRLQFMKNDNSQKKGAELLMSHTTAPSTPPGNYGLNVEVGSDGSVRVIPPLGAPTNSTPH